MDLSLRVIFTYDINDRHTGTGEGTSFVTIDELKTAIKNGRDYYQTPYRLNIGRSVLIIDNDALKPSDSVIEKIPGNYHGAPVHPVVVGREGVNFIVSDKVFYPRDVRKKLVQKYGNVLDFDAKNQWAETQPVYFSGVVEHTKYDSKNGTAKLYTSRSVNCRALNDQDIVVDTNLNQIWPIKTNKTPTILTELLSKTKEEIKQR